MTDLKSKSLAELQFLIAEAKDQLQSLQQSKRQSVIAQINELANSIGITVEIYGDDGKKISKIIRTPVMPRYRNPNDYSQARSGRGIKPKWILDLLNEGRNLDDFLIER